MVYVFVLKLQNGKYYVGNSVDENGIRAIMKQKRKFNLKWLNEYKPLEILNVYNNGDIFDLDKLTKQMMAAHGIENVRGGAYEEWRLSRSDINHIEKEIFSALGMCMYCGSNMHRTAFCERRTLKWKINNLIRKIKSKLCYFEEQGTEEERRQLIRNSYQNVNEETQNLMEELSLSDTPPASTPPVYRLKDEIQNRRNLMDSLDSIPSPPPERGLMYNHDVISPIFEEQEAIRTPSPLVSPGIRPVGPITPPEEIEPTTPIITLVEDTVDLSADERANLELNKPIRKLLDSDDDSMSITPEDERVILFEAKLTESEVIEDNPGNIVNHLKNMRSETVENHPLLDTFPSL